MSYGGTFYVQQAAETPKMIHDLLDAGHTVPEIAEACGVSASRVYQLMRKLGRSASVVAAARSERPQTAVPCGTLEGYRVCGDGRVQTCWSTGQHPRLTDQWRDLRIQVQRPGTTAASLYVRLGGAHRRQRPALLTVYLDAFGERRRHRAEQLHQEMRRRMGLE